MEEKIKKNIKALEDLAEEGRIFELKVCPQCMAVGLSVMDVLGLYAPLSPVKYVCKECGWVGRAVIEITNRRIDEYDEEVLEDIISMFSEEGKTE